jgi:hypothetical protein
MGSIDIFGALFAIAKGVLIGGALGFFAGLAAWFVVMGIVAIFANIFKTRTKSRL